MSKKVQFTLRIEEDILDKIRIESAVKKISMSDLITDKITKCENCLEEKENSEEENKI